MSSIVFKSTMPALAVITKFTTAALMLVALAACNSGGGGGGGGGGDPKKDKPTQVFKNLKAAGFNQGVDLSWDAVTGATSYTVYYSKAHFDKTDDSGVISIDKTTDTNISITNLTNNTTYHLRVATIIKDVSHLSGIISTKTNLRAPINLKATGVYQGVDLSWDMVRGATRYTVYYHTDSFSTTTDSTTDTTADGKVKSQTVQSPALSTRITGLANGTPYYLRVKAINADEDKKLSTEIVTAKAVLAPPILKAIGAYKQIDLSWGKLTGAESYTVYYSETKFDTTSDSVQSRTDITTNNTSFTGLANGTTYYFRAVAKYPNDQYSGLSAEAFATAMLPKTTIKEVTARQDAIDLTWDMVGGATNYKVYYGEKRLDGDDGTSDSEGFRTITTPNVTNISISGLDAGTKYYLRVEAISDEDNGYTSLSDQVEATTILAAPTVMATARQGAIDLSWGAVTEATSYKVYYHTASFGSANLDNVQDKTTDTNSISITDLSDDTTYYFRVIASKGKVSSALSEITSAKTTTSAITKPDAPTTVTATVVNEGIDLTWDAVDNATSYTVYYRKDKSFDSITLSLDSTTDIKTTSISLTDLSADTTYYFGVIAINASGSSALSQIVSATTKRPAPTIKEATARLGAIDLTWDMVTGADSYKVYYHTASFGDTTDSAIQNKTDITADNTSITGLDNGTEYFIRIVASSNTKGDSVLSKVVSAITKLPAPASLGATGKDKAIDLTWVAVDKATSYTVYYRKDNSFDSTNLGDAQDKTTDTASITLTDLSADTEYFFRVIAVNPKISSALSQIESATTKRPAPQPSAAASIISPAAVDLSWDAVSGVSGYSIYYAKQSLDELRGGYTNYNTNGVGGKLETTTDTSITIGDLSADTRYYFVVAADYSGDESAAPEVSADSSYIAELAIGGSSGCVRLNTGRIKCWGKNNKGQLGLGDTTDRHTATDLSSDLRAKQLSVGDEHSCAIDLSNDLHCWGDNDFLQLGLDMTTDRIKPEQVTQAKLAKNVSLVTAGVGSTCAQAGSTNYCWGDQRLGALGIGETTSDKTMDAQKINKIPPGVKQFALGWNSGCAIDASDVLWCWGNNWFGQVGNNKSGIGEKEIIPVKPTLLGDSKATMLDGGASHYCAVDKAKKIQCWGWNTSGQLGIGSTATSSKTPQYVLASTPDVHLSNVSKVATGNEHSCALLITGGKVRCWGKGADGRIGTNGGSNRLIAGTSDILGINNAFDIAAGSAHTCVLLNDKVTVKCWGLNDEGQLGRGIIGGSSPTPLEVKGL